MFYNEQLAFITELMDISERTQFGLPAKWGGSLAYHTPAAQAGGPQCYNLLA